MHPIATMCRVLGVSPGGYYARLKRPPSARAQADGELSTRIAAIHRRSQATYGVPRVHAELKAQGRHVGHKRVARLMSTAGLYGASRRRWVTTTVRDRAAKPASDLVERNFTAAAPNRLWVADITYIPTWAGFLYLAVVLDAFTRLWAGRWKLICGPACFRPARPDWASCRAQRITDCRWTPSRRATSLWLTPCLSNSAAAIRRRSSPAKSRRTPAALPMAVGYHMYLYYASVNRLQIRL